MEASITQIITSPVGNIRILGIEEAIFEVKFCMKSVTSHLGKDSEIDKCAQQLLEYFAGDRTEFDLNLKPNGTEFQQKVWGVLEKIPFGKTTTYEQQTLKLGDLKAIRAVASSNGKNPIAIIIPCHRVIGKDGSLTGYAGGLHRKEWLLQHEGAINGEQMKIFG